MYTIRYFIKKFESIPMYKWARYSLKNKHGQSDVLGHCGIRWSWQIEYNYEAISLIKLFTDYGLDVTTINDLSDEHPKIAILNALKDMK